MNNRVYPGDLLVAKERFDVRAIIHGISERLVWIEKGDIIFVIEVQKIPGVAKEWRFCTFVTFRSDREAIKFVHWVKSRYVQNELDPLTVKRVA